MTWCQFNILRATYDTVVEKRDVQMFTLHTSSHYTLPPKTCAVHFHTAKHVHLFTAIYARIALAASKLAMFVYCTNYINKK